MNSRELKIRLRNFGTWTPIAGSKEQEYLSRMELRLMGRKPKPKMGWGYRKKNTPPTPE
jgi:hypothetical protein